jgi:hypothetical protein
VRLAPFVAAALAVALSWPAVATGWFLDDLHHRAALTPVPVHARGYGLDPGISHLFAFANGDVARNVSLMRSGALPWWADPELKVSFYRPVAAATHVLDYKLWPGSSRLMHIHSLAWLFAGILTAGLLYRRLLPPGVAALAVLLFAVDDAHAFAATWIAQRNQLIVLCAGVLAIVAHVTWRRRRSWAWAVGSCTLLSVALLAGESAIAVVAYLIAYAVTLDGGTVRSRVLSLAPALAVAVAWRLAGWLAGFGLAYSDSYLDPARQPLQFLLAFLERAPLLLLGQWTVVRPEILLVLPQFTALAVILGLLTVLALTWAMWPVLREHAVARFMAFGMLLSIVPLCATFAHSRNLLLVGIGGMGLLALFLSRLPELLRGSAPVARWGRGGIGAVLVITHAIVAPVMLWRTTSLREYDAWHVHLPDADDLTGKTVVVVNGPANFVAAHFPLERDAAGLSVPGTMRALFPSIAAVTVERPSDQVLRFSAADGWLRTPLDLLTRSLARPFAPNQEIDLGDVLVQVNQLSADGRPSTVTCRFGPRLDDPSLVWVAFVDGAYRRWQPPPVGGRAELALPLPQ